MHVTAHAVRCACVPHVLMYVCSRSVDMVETGDESLVVQVAKVREALGLPGLSVRSANLCRDKPAMKEALRRAGVPCAASDAVSSKSEVLCWRSSRKQLRADILTMCPCGIT